MIGGNTQQFCGRLLDFLLEVAREYGPPVLGNGLVTSEGEFWHRQRNPGATSIRCPKVGSASLFHLRDWVHM